MVVEYLADQPAAFLQVAEWLHREWHRAIGYSRQETEQELRGRLNRTAPPLTLVAMEGGAAIGTASLIADDHPAACGRDYCLAGLYVLPACRGRGIGTRLCRRVAWEAQHLNIPRLVLYTREHELFYQRLGWRKVVETVIEVGPGLELVAFMESVGRTLDEKSLTVPEHRFAEHETKKSPDPCSRKAIQGTLSSGA